METLLIEIKNKKALGILHELEELDLIKVVGQKDENLKQTFADKYWSVLTLEESDSLTKHLEEIRNEW